MDLDWAEGQCDRLVKLAQDATLALTTVTSSGRNEHREPALANLNEQIAIVRAIAEQIVPDSLGYFRAVKDVRDWSQVAGHVRGAIRTRRDFAEQLAPVGPQLAARSLHPRVWGVASQYWDTGFYDDAVDAAAKIVGALARTKLERPNLDESAIGDAFSIEEPQINKPRLRFPQVDPEDTRTWNSVHVGALHYAKGCFMALRNPRAHTIMNSDPDVALEHLAAFSVLARWIDDCEVAQVEGADE